MKNFLNSFDFVDPCACLGDLQGSRDDVLRTATLCYGKGNGTPLQYSCLENPMDGGAWWAAVRGVAKSRTVGHD